VLSPACTGDRWHFTNAQGVEEAVTVSGATNAEALEGALFALQPDFLARKAQSAGPVVPAQTADGR
jgi:hypothetical protein